MILLDTSALIWVLEDSPRLGPTSRERLADGTRIFVSAISMVEIAIKEMTGKLTVDDDVLEVVQQAGFAELPLRFPDAMYMRNFPELVGHDPFDRMLVAQAEANGMDFLTSDRRLLALDRRDILDAKN